MAVVVFLRGVNVGGRRRLRPSLLAQQLRAFEAENIGAAGTLLVRRPGSRAALRAALALHLPFATAAVICDARELVQLAGAAPFGAAPAAAGEVRFVTIMARASRVPALPVHFPGQADWLVRVMGAEGRFLYGVYRRHMKTIGCLGQLDKLAPGPVTTRNWNTIEAVLQRITHARALAARSRRGAP